jgi:hypothetical protein
MSKRMRENKGGTSDGGKIMSRIRKLKVERIIRELKEVRDTSTMNSFNTGNEELTKTVKDATRLWRATWLVEPLTRLIKDIESEMMR